MGAAKKKTIATSLMRRAGNDDSRVIDLSPDGAASEKVTVYGSSQWCQRFHLYF